MHILVVFAPFGHVRRVWQKSWWNQMTFFNNVTSSPMSIFPFVCIFLHFMHIFVFLHNLGTLGGSDRKVEDNTHNLFFYFLPILRPPLFSYFCIFMHKFAFLCLNLHFYAYFGQSENDWWWWWWGGWRNKNDNILNSLGRGFQKICTLHGQSCLPNPVSKISPSIRMQESSR